MTNTEITALCDAQIDKQGYVDFPNEVFANIDKTQAEYLAEKYASSVMMFLPQYELNFFEWLKTEDIAVWNDLWLDEHMPPYLIGMSFLPSLLDQSRGFPICDLLENDNYYFTKDFFLPEHAQLFLESVKERFIAKEPLTTAQLLALEISLAPIDLWHFAFRHKIPLDAAKQAVRELVDDKVIVHFTDAAHLAPFVG
jgi:hypothetical protein